MHENSKNIAVPPITISSKPSQRTLTGHPIAFTISGIRTYDSVTYSLAGSSYTLNDSAVSIPTDSTTPAGRTTITLIAYLNQKTTRTLISTEILPKNPPKNRTYTLIKTLPHSTDAYTQGLLFHNGFLYESTGQRGESSLRKVDPKNGSVIQQHALPAEYFAEGLARNKNLLYQLTWTERTGFMYDLNSLKPVGQFTYPTQGWGAECRNDTLYISDGTEAIHLYSTNGFTPIGRISVYDNKGPVKYINELEFIGNTLYANVYLTDRIIGIDPKTGTVTESIDLSSIYPKSKRNPKDDVLNGIAHDPTDGSVYITGKYWPHLYKIKLK